MSPRCRPIVRRILLCGSLVILTIHMIPAALCPVEASESTAPADIASGNSDAATAPLIEYLAGEMGYDHSIRIFPDGRFTGWQGQESTGIPLRGVVQKDRFTALQSILTERDVLNLPDVTDTSGYNCEGGSELSITMPRGHRRFRASCECQPDVPGSGYGSTACAFYAETAQILTALIDEATAAIPCDQRPAGWQAGCYAQEAIDRGDVSLCEKIPSEATGHRDHCYRKLAEKLADPGLCDKLGPTEYDTADMARSACLTSVAFHVADPAARKQVCAAIGSGVRWIEMNGLFRVETERELCFLYLVRDTKDPELCTMFSPRNRIACLSELVPERVMEDDMRLIEQLCQEEPSRPEHAGRDANWLVTNCLNQWAYALKNPQLCKRMTPNRWGDSDEDACLATIAWKTNDAEICRQIRGVDQRDACYRQLASQTNRAEYCDRMSRSQDRPACRNEVTFLNSEQARKP